MKIIFTVYNNMQITKEMKNIPRIGDTIPLFFQPWPKVTEVIWFPAAVSKEFKNIDVLIMVE